MARTARKPLQVYLEPDQERALRAYARSEHVSLAELIRRSVDRYMSERVPPEADPSLEIIGLGRSGRADLAERHDEIITETARI